MILAKIIKHILLRKKGIFLDDKSDINWGLQLGVGFKRAKIVDSKLEINSMGNGCFIEHTIAYGKIELGNYVSISGPGTILHAVIGKIQIGNFSSIGQNVSINEFNHNIRLPSTYAMQLNFFSKNFKDDVTSKGDVIIEEDVWIGSNSVILSGVRIGRGAVIAAGSIVNKDVPPYAIVGGVPCKVIKMRFTANQIEYLEKIRWWEWDDKKIMDNCHFFETEL